MPESRNPDDLLLFTPVPQRRKIARGWTAEAQRAFIAALSRCALVTVAARSVGKTARSAYQLRARPDAASFAEAWDLALQMGLDDIRSRAINLALEPEQIPVFYQGRIIGWRTRTNESLLIAALNAHYNERNFLSRFAGKVRS